MEEKEKFVVLKGEKKKREKEGSWRRIKKSDHFYKKKSHFCKKICLRRYFLLKIAIFINFLAFGLYFFTNRKPENVKNPKFCLMGGPL